MQDVIAEMEKGVEDTRRAVILREVLHEAANESVDSGGRVLRLDSGTNVPFLQCWQMLHRYALGLCVCNRSRNCRMQPILTDGDARRRPDVAII